VPIISLILSSRCVHGRERPVWSCGVVNWISRPLNEQPVAWSDSWSQQSWMTIKKTLILAQPEFLKPIYLGVHRIVVLIYLDLHQNLARVFQCLRFLMVIHDCSLIEVAFITW